MATRAKTPEPAGAALSIGDSPDDDRDVTMVRDARDSTSGPLELARHLINFLANPVLAYTIGEQGRQFCLETRSVEVIGARLRELYATAYRRVSPL